MITLINEKRTENEVVRVSLKSETDLSKNNGKTASHILKSLILEDKQVYIKYIWGGYRSAELADKTNTILRIMKRMLNEDLTAVCGGVDKVPAKYVGKKLIVLTELPYLKETVLNKVTNQNGEYKVETDDETKKAIVIKLHLAIEE